MCGSELKWLREQAPSVCVSSVEFRAILIPSEWVSWKVHISLMQATGRNLVKWLQLAVKEEEKCCLYSVPNKLAVYYSAFGKKLAIAEKYYTPLLPTKVFSYKHVR